MVPGMDPMGKVNFTLMCKPFSINAWTYSDKRHKTKEAVLWTAQVNELLEEHSKALGELAMDFDKFGGCFRIQYTFLFPNHIFYNRDGQISSKSMDLTNVEKSITDRIFNDCMGVNDKSIVEVRSQKLPGPLYAIEVTLEHDNACDADSLISTAANAHEDGTE